MGSIVLALSLLVGADGSTASSGGRPHIVLIVADDLGYGDLGCYGATAIRTPAIDRLAAAGLRFTNAYAPSSTCTPSRYALMTGEYGWRQPPQKTSILDGDAPLAIDPDRRTLADVLHEAGYATGLVGKWHLGLGDGRKPVDFNGPIEPGPLELGFESAFFIPATVDRVPCVFIDGHRVHNLDPADPIRISYRAKVGDEPTGAERPERLKVAADAQHSGTIVGGISRIGYMSGGARARWVDEDIAATLVARSIDFLEENRRRPCFLYLGLHDPHKPHWPAERFRGTSDCGIRGDCIHQIDWAVGEMLAALDRLAMADNTLIIVTSDNGPVLYDGYFDRSAEDCGGHRPAGPLRGWKYLVYEGGTRVPFIARWPARVPRGTSDQMLGLNDLFATLAALVGRPVAAGEAVDSLNLLPALLGSAQRPLRQEIVEHGISGALALRQGDWKFIPANSVAASGIGSGANPADTRFAEARITAPLLFNLRQDPGETINLAAQYPDRLAAMQRRLEEVRRHPNAPAE